MKYLFVLLTTFFTIAAGAQVSKVSLQASGLTCSMCSKAVKEALEAVGNVAKVQVDIKNQQYNLTFKDPGSVDLDQLAQAVEDAGFSVASLKVTADLDSMKLEKDAHVQIANKKFHFLNGAGKQ